MGVIEMHLKNNCEAQLPGLLTFSIKEAFRHLDELIEKNPILKEKEMKKTYGHIRQGLVDVALKWVFQKTEMPNQVQSISAKKNTNSYTYVVIEVKGAIISPVKTRNGKSMPRRALHRSTASLMNRQYNLFEEPENINKKYSDGSVPYLLLTYGGENYQLGFVELGLPDIDTEMWIDKVDIIDAPLLLSNLSEKESKKELELTFTSVANKMLEGDMSGKKSI